MKTIILHNIISNNSVYKLSSYIKRHKEELGNVEVWFCAETEDNRQWTLQEEIDFEYTVLSGNEIKLRGKDLFTYFINWNIWKKLTAANPDRLIINGWDQFAYQLSFFWGWLYKKKLTLWSGSTKYEKSWRRTLTKPLVRWFVWTSDNYIAYGTRAKEYLVSLGAQRDKIEIFLNDVNKEYFTTQAKKLRFQKEVLVLKEKYGLTQQFNLLFVGQFIERKGILDLLQTYCNLKESGTIDKWGLVLVGSGLLEEKMGAIIKARKIKDVVFLGHVDQYDLPEVYAICDILVLPSREEVWGLVVNEALYSGLTVVVSNACGCVPDIVQEHKKGYTFKIENE